MPSVEGDKVPPTVNRLTSDQYGESLSIDTNLPVPASASSVSLSSQSASPPHSPTGSIPGSPPPAESPTPPNDKSPDGVIKCLCGDTSESKHGSGTVQCDHCCCWSHIACYSLDEQIAAQDSFEFLCNACAPPPKSKDFSHNPTLTCNHLLKPNPHNKENSRSIPENENVIEASKVTQQTNTTSCTLCLEVPVLKSRFDQLSLQVRSLQYQLLSVNEKLLRKEASYSRQMTRPLPSSKDINSHPVRDAHVTSVGSRGNHSGKSTPINRNPRADLSKPRTPLVVQPLSGGSVQYYINPRHPLMMETVLEMGQEPTLIT